MAGGKNECRSMIYLLSTSNSNAGRAGTPVSHEHGMHQPGRRTTYIHVHYKLEQREGAGQSEQPCTCVPADRQYTHQLCIHVRTTQHTLSLSAFTLVRNRQPTKPKQDFT
jgi:hypothetical protein